MAGWLAGWLEADPRPALPHPTTCTSTRQAVFQSCLVHLAHSSHLVTPGHAQSTPFHTRSCPVTPDNITHGDAADKVNSTVASLSQGSRFKPQLSGPLMLRGMWVMLRGMRAIYAERNMGHAESHHFPIDAMLG